jgi:hypothetical protein
VFFIFGLLNLGVIVHLLMMALLQVGITGSTGYTIQDALVICISMLATGHTQRVLGGRFGIDHTVVCDIVRIFLPAMATAAVRMWMPASIDSEAELCAFKYFPYAIAAIDSTPIRVMDPVNAGWLKGLVWNHKHHIPTFNLHVAVAPNGICIAFLALLPGGRHDKRALDEINAYKIFSYLGPPNADGVCPERVFAVLFRCRLHRFG